MKQYIKDNFGLLTVSIKTTIEDFKSFLESATEAGIKDSPQKTIHNTIIEYSRLLSNLLNDEVTEYNEKQLKMIMEHRLRILKAQKEQVDTTIPLIEKVIEEIDKSIT